MSNTSERETFVQARRNSIGGSDIGAVLGVSKFKTATDVYLSKTTEQPEQQGEHLYWGDALEDPITDRFEAETGWKVQRDPAIRFHPAYPWASANADGLILDENGEPQGILEIKTSSAFKTADWGAEDTDEIPLEYIAQVQWYMEIFNVDFACIAVLIGGNRYRQFRVEKDLELIRTMLEKARHFWEENILKGIPPEPAESGDLLKTHPHDDGETVEADTEALCAYNELKTMKAQAAELAEQIKEREEIVKLKIGAHKGLSLNGSVICTWASQIARRFDSSAFKAAHPDTYAAFTKESNSRVLRLK